MKKILALVALLAAVWVSPLAAENRPSAAQNDADVDSERIVRFDSHITVNQDRSMVVAETIEVQSAGNKIRHGIYRDFPTSYSDNLGNRYTVEFKVVGVSRDGATEDYHTSQLSNGVRVYFGSSGTLLDPGRHTYVFTYRTNRQLGFFADHDELYWNVTGNAWDFAIDEASATVVLPPRVRDAVKELGGYTGYQAAKGKDYTASRDDEGNPVFRASNLAARQGLTIVVTWPKGLIAAPTVEEKREQFVLDNRSAAVGVAGLVLVLVYYFLVWAAVGRDPKSGTIVPLYEPQDGLSPGGMRFLKEMGFDSQVFTSAILGLATKGYLTIERDESKTYILLRKSGYGEVAKRLSSEEQILATRLFEEGSKLELKQEHHELLQKAQTAFKHTLQTEMEKKYFVTNSRYLWPGVILTAVTVVAMMVSGGADSAVGLFMTVWLSFWSFGVAMLMVSVYHAWKSVATAGLVGVAGALFLTLFSIPFLAGECIGFFMLQKSTGIVPVAVILAGVACSIVFHFLLKAPTRLGRQLLDRVEGFKLFLKETQGPVYATMASPAQTPELFERFLPYALALGVEHAWAQKFSSVLAAAATSGGQTHGAGYVPSWYSGTGFSTFTASEFTSSFSSSFSSAVSSASTSPSSSSGSGGGGSSGGGGGGGGGGGW